MNANKDQFHLTVGCRVEDYRGRVGQNELGEIRGWRPSTKRVSKVYQLGGFFAVSNHSSCTSLELNRPGNEKEIPMMPWE